MHCHDMDNGKSYIRHMLVCLWKVKMVKGTLFLLLTQIWPEFQFEICVLVNLTCNHKWLQSRDKCS